ncbi:MAG: response regulator [Flavobacteriales bacterium]|nr:response regulator [Flavobacteriales bacterium]
MIVREHLNILLVDDNDIDIAVNTKLLKLADLTDHIFSFSSCRLFLKYITDNADGLRTKTNLILLDIMMPGMYGFECLNEFAKMPDDLTSSFHIFMLSSSIDRNDIKRAEQSKQVLKVLEKPLDVYHLKRLIEEISIQ